MRRNSISRKETNKTISFGVFDISFNLYLGNPGLVMEFKPFESNLGLTLVSSNIVSSDELFGNFTLSNKISVTLNNDQTEATIAYPTGEEETYYLDSDSGAFYKNDEDSIRLSFDDYSSSLIVDSNGSHTFVPIGAVSYTASTCLSYALTGEWNWSWGQFAGSALGGALGGILSYVCPKASFILIGGLTGFSSSGFGMLLQNQFEGTNYSNSEIFLTSLFEGFISAGVTAVSSYIKIPGLNSGKNSYAAITKQINSKFRKGIISHISFNTFSKMLTNSLVSEIYGICMDGVFSNEDVDDQISFWLGGF